MKVLWETLTSVSSLPWRLASRSLLHESLMSRVQFPAPRISPSDLHPALPSVSSSLSPLPSCLATLLPFRKNSGWGGDIIKTISLL